HCPKSTAPALSPTSPRLGSTTRRPTCLRSSSRTMGRRRPSRSEPPTPADRPGHETTSRPPLDQERIAMKGFRTYSFALGAILGAALAAAAPTPAAAQLAVVGEWSAPFDTVNVMVHASVLPTGKVLFWGRREPG